MYLEGLIYIHLIIKLINIAAEKLLLKKAIKSALQKFNINISFIIS